MVLLRRGGAEGGPCFLLLNHHTHQSALGLPFIVRKTHGGREYGISEYTMNKIIASVYDLMEDTGVKEGILFLDEINCV